MKFIYEMSEKELKQALKQIPLWESDSPCNWAAESEYVPAVIMLSGELNRRAQNRQTSIITILSVIAIVVSIVSLFWAKL